MKYFNLKTLLFSFPVLLFVAVPWYILFISKESFYPVDKLVEKKSKYLIGYVYHENNYSLIKRKVTELRKPHVLALGSSRVLQFRESMFTTSFYNAGFTISSVNDFISFMKSLPQAAYPKYLIISLDQWMFNSQWDNLKITRDTSYWTEDFSVIPNMIDIKSIYRDLLQKKINLAAVRKNATDLHIGLNACMNTNGLRNDGSFLYGDQIEKLKNNDPTVFDYKFSDTFQRIKKGRRRFEFGHTINQEAVNKLEEFLRFCSEYKINLIGFLPPFADTVKQTMTKSGNYTYIPQLDKAILPIFEKYNFEFYSFGTLSQIGSNDTEAIDGFHGGEKTYLRMMISMLGSGSELNKVCDIRKLKIDLANAEGPHLVYQY